MNIAFITPEYITEKGFDGGLSNYIHKISLALKERGHTIYVIVSSDKNEQFVQDGITIIRVNMQSSALNYFRKIFRGRLYAPLSWMVQSWKLNKELKKIHKNTKIDIAQFASYTATAFFRPRSIPSVSRLSSYQALWDEAYNLPKNLSRSVQYYIETNSLKNSDAIFGPSKLIANIVGQKINRDITIIESPLSLSNDSNIKLYEDTLKGKSYLLFFGSLGTLKGLKEIGDILSDLLDDFLNIYFVFVGKDQGYKGKPMMDYIWHKSGENRGRCIYLGNMKQEFLQPIVDNAYAVVLPSRIDNLPNTCTESMAKGKIVVGTRGASFEQLIQDKENGFLCEKENPISLLKTIRKVLFLDIATKKRIEHNAKNTTERLNPKIISKDLEEFYTKVIHEY